MKIFRLCVLFQTVAALTALSISFAMPRSAFAEHSAGTVIDRVEIRGNARIEPATVLLQAKSQPGDDYDASQVSADVKEIYKTGFFEQVAAKLERTSGATVLVFQVVEKPAIRHVKIEGNKEVKEDKIKEKLNISTRFFLDRKKIDAGVEELKKYYQSEGYYGTTIDYNVNPAQENQVDLAVQITEGDKKRIREIAFEGNKQVDSSELKDVVDTATYKWWSSWITGSGVVKQEALDNDVKALGAYYLNHGFVEVHVGQPVVEETTDGLRVVYKVEEGDVYTFSKISASGDLVNKSQEETLKGIVIESGEKFNLEQLRKDTFTVSEKFTDVGYAFANVEPATDIHRESKTVDVNFVVNKGNLVTVNRINITGNKKTQDNVVRRSLQLGEQEFFSSSKIRRSQELLQRLGYFDEVTITPEPTSVQDQVDLGVSVREGNTGTFSLGAGVSSGDGFIFSSRISENNLFGTGNALALDVNTGTNRENFVLSFTDPRVNDSRLSFGADLLSTKHRFDNFDRNQAGGSLTFGYPLWFLGPEALDDVRASLTYELLKIKIDNVDADAPELIKDNEGSSISSSVTPQVTRNTIDNPLDPTKGSKQQVSVELAGLGGDQKFWLVQASNGFYYPLWKPSFGNFVFAQRTRFGYGETFNDEDFPLFKRFFPGGINSVRGFESRELGPKDEQGNEYGGNKQLIANFELIYPLISSVGISGVVFYDVGNAFDDNESIDIGELRQAVGWGIRWKSPLAPIRIEFGYPIDRKEGEKSFVTNFSFGAPS
ncbi:MAG: outer membrane protein assembly factor BamA [Bdellovibrionota bacterium]